MIYPNHASVCAAKIMAQDLLEFLTLASRAIGRDNPIDSKMLVRDAVEKLDDTARMLGYELRAKPQRREVFEDAR